MHFDFNSLFPILMTVIVPVLGGLINHSIKTPKDHERASLLGTLAGDIVAIVIAESKGASWATMLQQVVNQLRTYGITANEGVLVKVATAALLRAGIQKT